MTNNDPLTALRLRLHAHGFRPVPVKSASKSPTMSQWEQVCAVAGDAEIRQWATTHPGCRNTGILCDGLACVDIDVLIPELAARVEAFASDQFGHTPLRRIGREPKSLLVYRTAASISKMMTPELFLPDGTKLQVEILGRGQQFVAYGLHPDTHREYQWTDSDPEITHRDDLPIANETTLQSFLRDVEAMLREAGGQERPPSPGRPDGATQALARPRADGGGADRAELRDLGIRAWGAVNQKLSSKTELRFGRNGSKSIKVADKVWYDYEAGVGGGYRDLYRLVHGEDPPPGHGRAPEFVSPRMRSELGDKVAHWDYQDRDGTIVARVVRFEKPGVPGKTFRQCRPDGAKWSWSLKGVTVPLYRLPELLAAPPDEVVFLTEGEKQADALRAWGLTATTNAMGAGKFRAHHAEVLAGRSVVILPDNDEAGREHASKATQELHRRGARVQIVALPELPEKGDIIDWIEGGGTRSALEELAALAPVLEPPQGVTVTAAELHDLPVIHIAGGTRADAADAALSAMVAARIQFFQRDQRLVRCFKIQAKTASGEVVPTPGIVPVTRPYLERAMAGSARWVKTLSRGGKVNVDPPSDVAEQILSMTGEWPFPSLVGVISTPTMRPDGSLLLDEGYDVATGYYLLGAPAMPTIPDQPTRDDAAAALERLDALLGAFPFVEEVHRSVALAAIMTPVLRAALPVSPAFVVSAPAAGTGKSFLIDIIAMIALGDVAPVVALPAGMEEQEKRLMAAVLSGHPLIVLDNLTVSIEGDFLCQLTERPVLKMRPLGTTSSMPQVGNAFTVYANGNNVVVSSDMSRRTLRCEMDANLEDPTKREFDSPSPLEMIRADRGAYVAAVLTIARAYAVAESPGRLRYASYDAWSAVVRSALIWLGCADPVETVETIMEENPIRVVREAVFTAWATELRIDNRSGARRGWTTAELIEAANQDVAARDGGYERARPALHESLLAAASVRSQGERVIDPTLLGKFLSQAKHLVVGGYKLGVDRSDRNRPRWTITAMRGQALHQPAPEQLGLEDAVPAWMDEVPPAQEDDDIAPFASKWLGG